jgi:4-hydroxy-2-oxoheptanedioate aldolase
MLPFQSLLTKDVAALGTWVKLSSIESVELMALAGFDFVVLDLEHSPMSLETASILIAVARGRGLCPLVRIPDHSQTWVQRCLDAGASGIFAPHVDTTEEARAVARAARFEPNGTRGVGPTSRAGNWGLQKMGTYIAEGGDAAVIVQLESDLAIRNTRRIIETGKVDAIFVGPADLSVSLGVGIGDEEVTTRVQNVLDVCTELSIPCGVAVGDPASAARLGKAGFSFVVVSNDATILGSGASQLVESFQASCAR